MGGIIMRISTPYFNMYTAYLTETVNAIRFRKLKKYIEQNELRIELKQDTLPVSLRWNMHPAFGFPRKPFNVYRRTGDYKFKTIINNQNLQVNGSHRINLPGGDMYVVIVHINLQSGQRCTVKPLNDENKVIPYNFSEITSSGNVVIKCPFTRGLLIEGNGEITACAGVLQQELINDKGWQLIQTVGLPFETGMIEGLGYEGTTQGNVTSPTTALKACLQRLAIGNALSLPMPATGDATVPLPVWTAPEPVKYVDYLFNAGNSILTMIMKCLNKSDDLSFLPSQRQAAFLYEELIAGISQNGGASTEDALVKIPVVAASLLAATTDCFAALGLGFGTTDFISGKFHDDFNTKSIASTHVKIGGGADYMITANYIIRPQEHLPFPIFDELSKEIEFAALGCEMPLPEIPNTLEALSIQKNRPQHLDGPCTEGVKLRWNKSNIPQGYGIVSSYNDGTSQVLNMPHIFQSNCYQTFNTAVPKTVSTQDILADENDADRFIFTAPEEPVPNFGTESHKYLVAGLDVFGRWSEFRQILFDAVSPEKQNTGVLRTELKNTVVDPPAVVSVVDCEYKIEFSWRWADRSPQEIQFAGQYYVPVLGADPVRLTPSRFSKSSANPIEPVIRVSFDAAGNPTCEQGTVIIMPVSGGTPADLKKYMLVINNMQTLFTNTSPYKAGFVLFARALEKLRAPLNDFSNWSDGYTCFLPDPRKPATVFIDAVVNFTALPDAAKMARGVLSWPSATGALVYHVWEANEMAIRTTIDQPLKNLFPSDPDKYLKPITAPLRERANQLRDILTNSGGIYSSIVPLADKYFNRITKDPLMQPKMELTLPGSSKVLHLFKVSTVNAANIEGDKSGFTFFAVPQLIKPLAPRIELKKRKDITDGVERFFFDVHVLHGDYAPVSPPADPAIMLSNVKAKGFELYRVRKQILGNDVGAKGEPFKLSNSPGWSDTNVALLNGDVFKGKKIIDEVTPSWKPYCYQAVAVGKDNAPFGEVSGRSEGSITAMAFCFPNVRPTVTFSPGESIANSIVYRLVFSTNIPFEIVDRKLAQIEILHFNRTLNNFETVKKFEATSVRKDNAVFSLPTDTAVLSDLPLINHLAVNTAGFTKVSILVPRIDSVTTEKYNGLIRITDPLGKFNEFKF